MAIRDYLPPVRSGSSFCLPAAWPQRVSAFIGPGFHEPDVTRRQQMQVDPSTQKRFGLPHFARFAAPVHLDKGIHVTGIAFRVTMGAAVFGQRYGDRRADWLQGLLQENGTSDLWAAPEASLQPLRPFGNLESVSAPG